ncbi:ABC transporter ATP-binding protein [Pararobbsia silviterrae]|nr:ABC transporter ATP-binding protein [Pararobbsia silviterrae]
MHATTPKRATPLTIDALSVSYRTGAGRQLALDALSLSIGAGEAYGLVGESGSGKSTVALAIARYLAKEARIEHGRIELAGHDVHALGSRALRALRRHDLGFVYQDPARALNPTLTIGDQLIESFELALDRASFDASEHARAPTHSPAREPATHSRLFARPNLHVNPHFSRRDARAAALDMLDRVRMPSAERAAASYPHQLSGGMQQRAVIAMALAKAPALLILDEATTGLDATVEAEIIALIDTLRRASGTALLFISHKLPLVAGLCERVGILEKGRLVEEGLSSQVFDRPSHPYTSALIACIPTIGRTRRDGPLATLDDARQDRSREDVRRTGRPATPSETVDASGMRAASAEAMRSDTRPALELVDISKTFHIGRETVCALDHVHLAIHAGETLGLVGESGSGKTTLARIVAGLVAPDTGSVKLDGEPLPARVERRTRTHTSALQSVFQNPQSALNRAHRLRTLLGRAVGKLAGLRGRERDDRVRALLDAVHLPHGRLHARARELSGGQQQRVAIARAFAGRPRIVICDEPTSALDVSVQASILNLLVELQRSAQTSYLFISHDLAVVRYVADRVAVLYRGQIVESGPADRVFAAPAHPYTVDLLRAATRAANASAISPSPAASGSSGSSGSSDASGSSPTLTVTPSQTRGDAMAPHTDTSHRGCVYASRCTSSLGAICERERPVDLRMATLSSDDASARDARSTHTRNARANDAHIVRCHLYRRSDTAA